jgi:hypothetical protein
MIKLIDAKQTGVLYHYTYIKNLQKILNDKGLKSWEYNFISFSRYWNEDYAPCRIAFDGNKLSNKYKIRPFMDVDVEITKASNELFEAEEIIMWPINTLLPIVIPKYVIQIDILEKNYDDPSLILKHYSNQFQISITNRYSIVK